LLKVTVYFAKLIVQGTDSALEKRTVEDINKGLHTRPEHH